MTRALRALATATRALTATALLGAIITAPALAEPPTSTRQQARQHNDRGLSLHRAGKLEEGLAAFRAAIEADPEYAMGHYNVACSLALLRAAGKVCDVDAYRGAILEHLERAITLDPQRRERARVDDDLRAVHDTLGFQRVVLQRKLTTAADRRAVLVAVSWFGPSPGAYGPMSALDFHDDGTVSGWHLVFDDDGAPKRRPLAGRFTMGAQRIELHLEGAPAPATATLRWDGLELDGGERFTDDPDDCSA